MGKVLLVKPPFGRLLQNRVYSTYPLGLMLTASALKARDHEVAIYHDDVSNPDPIPSHHPDFQEMKVPVPDEKCLEPLGEVLTTFSPDVVGIGYCTSDRASAHTVAAYTREHGVKRLVAGGVHPSLLPDGELGVFDAVVVGEGDSPEAAVPFESKLRGVIEVSPVQDLDAVVADRDCVIGGERYPRYLKGMIQTQRGCPYNCGFCAAPKVFGTKVRRRDPGRVREEIEHLRAREGRIIDDSFGVAREHGIAVCWELAKIPYRWVCDVALQDIDDERVDMWLRGGCFQINIGIESGVERWQKLSGKHVPPGRPEEVVRQCVGQGLGVVLYFMIGFPGETLVELRSTLAYAKRLRDLGAKPCISIVTPYPRTEIWEMVGAGRSQDYSTYIHQSSGMGFADCTPEEWAEVVAEANRISV